MVTIPVFAASSDFISDPCGHFETLQELDESPHLQFRRQAEFLDDRLEVLEHERNRLREEVEFLTVERADLHKKLHLERELINDLQECLTSTIRLVAKLGRPIRGWELD